MYILYECFFLLLNQLISCLCIITCPSIIYSLSHRAITPVINIINSSLCDSCMFFC